jgi:hypothetical protein
VNSNYKGLPVCQAKSVLDESHQRFIGIRVRLFTAFSDRATIEQGAD